jgi:hypothetical protein
MCVDAARSLIDSGCPLAAYVPEGTSVPLTSPATPFPSVRVEIVQGRTGIAGGPASSRVGPGSAWGAGPAGGSLPMSASPGRIGKVCRVRLARLAPGTDASGATGGVLDPGDGLGGRVVRLAAGDTLIVPDAILGGKPDTDAQLRVLGIVAVDVASWLAECAVM